MKKLSTLSLAIFALTLITAALLSPFASAHNGERALVTIDPPDSIDTRSFGISPTGEVAGLFITSALPSAHADPRPLSEPIREDEDAFGGPPHSIAFHSNREGNNEVYLMNPDGSEQTRLTFDSRADARPDISPNGKQIVFVSNRIVLKVNCLTSLPSELITKISKSPVGFVSMMRPRTHGRDGRPTGSGSPSTLMSTATLKFMS